MLKKGNRNTKFKKISYFFLKINTKSKNDL